MSKLHRRQFLKLCGLMGFTLATVPKLVGCDRLSSREIINSSGFDGKVLIVGAGPAGMSAGYLLAQQGIDFQIIEAAPTYGGRIKRNNTFADFPIALGAEWLHVDASELARIVNDDDVHIDIQTVAYDPTDEYGWYEDGELYLEELGEVEDLKFVNSSWFDFYEEYIMPSISDRFLFDTEIISINYENEKVILGDRLGQEFTADKVIFTAPLKMLQQERISFTPPLSVEKQAAIASAPIWDGIKVFMEFSEKFYPVFIGSSDSDTPTGQRVYYDAAYGQNSSKNILGLFAVGEQARPYLTKSGADLKNHILDELDHISDGLASASYIKHIVQNWNQEPFANGAYLADNASTNISTALSKSVNNKIFFAGTAYTQEDDWGSVHNASRSAKDAVRELLASA